METKKPLIDWSKIDCKNLTYDGKKIDPAAIVLPQQLADFINGEDVLLVIEDKENFQVYAEIKDKKITNFECGTSKDYGHTIRFTTRSSVLEKIASSNSPIKEFKNAKESGAIKIHTQGVAFLKEMFLYIILIFVG